MTRATPLAPVRGSRRLDMRRRRSVRTAQQSGDRVIRGLVKVAMLLSVLGALAVSGILGEVGRASSVLQIGGVFFCVVAITLVALTRAVPRPTRSTAVICVTVALLFGLVGARSLLAGSGQTVLTILVTTGAYLLVGLAAPRAAIDGIRLAGRVYVWVCALVYVLPIPQRSLLFGASGGELSLVERVYRETVIFSLGDDGRLFGLTSSPNAAGAVLFLIILVEFLSFSFARPRLFGIATSVVGAVLLILTNSQTAIAATAIALFVLLLRGAVRRSLVVACWLFGAAPAVLTLVSLVQGSRYPLPPAFATGRGQVWAETTGLLAVDWQWGLDLAEVFPVDNSNAIGAAHTHNVLLQAWALWGLFALIAILILGTIFAYRVGATRFGPIFAGLCVLSFSALPIFALPGSINALIVAFLGAVMALVGGSGRCLTNIDLGREK